MTDAEARLIDTAFAAGVGVLILGVITLLLFVFRDLIRRSPTNALQVNAFSLADGLLKVFHELSAELRDMGKRDEVIKAAQTEVLRTISLQMKQDGVLLVSINTAVTTQAEARQAALLAAIGRQNLMLYSMENMLRNLTNDHKPPTPIHRFDLRAAVHRNFGAGAATHGYYPDPAIDSGNYLSV